MLLLSAYRTNNTAQPVHQKTSLCLHIPSMYQAKSCNLSCLIETGGGVTDQIFMPHHRIQSYPVIYHQIDTLLNPCKMFSQDALFLDISPPSRLHYESGSCTRSRSLLSSLFIRDSFHIISLEHVLNTSSHCMLFIFYTLFCVEEGRVRFLPQGMGEESAEGLCASYPLFTSSLKGVVLSFCPFRKTLVPPFCLSLSHCVPKRCSLKSDPSPR